MTDPRVVLPIRVRPSSREAVEKVAERDKISRSTAARRLLAFALQKMPPGWGSEIN